MILQLIYLLVGDDVITQTNQIFKNIESLLNHCNLTIENIVKTTIFVNDINDFTTINNLYSNFMNGHAPARSFVQVSRLPLDAKVEIEVVALEGKNA